MNDRFKLYSAVYLVLVNGEGKVLFEKRCNTGYMDGKIGFPAGHLDGAEAATLALTREAKEELGINIKPEELKFVHLSHRPLSKSGPKEYMDLFFECRKWTGQVIISEPEKCSEQIWLTPEEFINHPDAIPYLKTTMRLIQSGVMYSERT